MNAIRRFFNVAARGRTYLNVAYVWLAFPLGLAYFVFLVTGSALSLGLSLLWIGLLLMALFIMLVWALGQFERILSRWMLGEPVQTTKSDAPTFWKWLRGIVKDASTWKGAAFLLLKFPVGLACWVASVCAFAFSAAFIVAPFADYRGEVDFGLYSIQDPTGGWLFTLAGILLLFITLHLHNAMGLMWRFMARHLLTPRLIEA
ncbi:MAG TPA: sensor domain-containing protein [Thermoanaerobaculia bacterium]|nr:sensor domain-containing protein [Thermoanaerobaculia bacterium]